MKSKKEIQIELKNQNGLMHWEFLNPQIAKNILTETASKLTNDEDLRRDLVKWHKELLDRRYSATIFVTNEQGREAGYLNLHGFDPAVIPEIIDFLDWSVSDKGYISEKDFQKHVEKMGLKIERINIHNEEEIVEIQNIQTKVSFI